MVSLKDLLPILSTDDNMILILQRNYQKNPEDYEHIRIADIKKKYNTAKTEVNHITIITDLHTSPVYQLTINPVLLQNQPVKEKTTVNIQYMEAYKDTYPVELLPGETPLDAVEKLCEEIQTGIKDGPETCCDSEYNVYSEEGDYLGTYTIAEE